MEHDKRDLAALFNHYGSDKDINGYVQLYDTLLRTLRDHVVTLVEIGIGTLLPGVSSSMLGYGQAHYRPGGSLRAWRDYFANEKSRIIGLDVQPDTQLTDEPRIETCICDSTRGRDVAALMKKLLIAPDSLDVVIDDGSHLDTDQLKTLQSFYRFVRPDGLYIIEDIYPGSGLSANPKIIQEIVGRDAFFFVGVTNNLCVIHKRALASDRRGY